MVRDAEDGRGKAGDGDGMAGGRMGEGDLVGMQVIADVAGHRDAGAFGDRPRRSAPAVEWITDQRVAGRGEVDADLVRPARDDLDLDDRPVALRISMQDAAHRP